MKNLASLPSAAASVQTLTIEENDQPSSDLAKAGYSDQRREPNVVSMLYGLSSETKSYLGRNVI